MIFPEGTEIPKHFKEVRPGEYMPKLSHKAGKQIDEAIKALPVIYYDELNACIGVKRELFKCIGFAVTEDRKTFAFSVRPEWEFEVPNDCQEITHSEFKRTSE